jgi:hypothetical protein
MIMRSECRKISRLLWDYAAMALREPDMEQVEAHLTRCRACAHEAETYASVVGIVRTGRFERMPDSQATWHNLRAALERERKPVRGLRITFSTPALAGSLVLAALLALFFSSGISIESENGKHVGRNIVRLPGDTNPTPQQLGANSPGFDQGGPSDKNKQFEGRATQVANSEAIPDNSIRRRGLNKGRREQAVPSLANSISPQRQPRIADYVSGDQADRPYDNSPQRDFVLTPVGMGGSQGKNPHFVMGSIPQSEGGITTASYTKPLEEAPVW